jgi:transcriptional regulatory protein RtcR
LFYSKSHRQKLLNHLHIGKRMLVQVGRRKNNSRSLSDAGRTLFGASRGRKAVSNDDDRLRKYLLRFDLEFPQIMTAKIR